MASQYDIADFYRQLALLTKSELPLPETLQNLADAASSRSFKEELRKLGEETAKGRPLSDAMKDRPNIFPPFFSRMIDLGERNGTLPAVLSELAAVARINYQLSALVKDILFYPVVTVLFAFLVLILMSYYVIPQFSIIFTELLEGAYLPYLTRFVLGTANLIHDYIAVIAALYVICAVCLSWIFIGGGKMNKLLLRLTRLLPLSEMVFYNFAMAHVCTLWSVMMKQRTPDSEALRCAADMAELPELSIALRNVSDACSKGTPLAEAIESEPDISRLLYLSIANNPEGTLPQELEKLAELFRERGYHGFKRVGAAWELITVAGMAMVVGGVILFLFIPLIARIFNS